MVLKFTNCFKPELQNHTAKNIKLGEKFVTGLYQNCLLQFVVKQMLFIRGNYKFSFSLKIATIN